MSPTTPTRSKPGATRNQLLARLHCLAHERAWSDDEYRDILHGLTGKRSAADLDEAGLARAIAVISQRSVSVGQAEPATDAEWRFIATAAAEKRPLLRKIAATCTALGVRRAYAEGIARRQSGGVDRRLEMCSYDELRKIAGALSRTQQYRQRQAEKAGGAA